MSHGTNYSACHISANIAHYVAAVLVVPSLHLWQKLVSSFSYFFIFENCDLVFKGDAEALLLNSSLWHSESYSTLLHVTELLAA
jgi:hypothetical protein